MEFNVDMILTRTTGQVPVGDKTLAILPFSVAQHTELGEVMKTLDLQNLLTQISEAASPIVDAVKSADPGAWGEAFLVHGPKLIGMAINIVGADGGEAITRVAQIALDNEDNHNVLRKLFSEGTEVTEEFGIFITSPAVRAWVKRNATVAQALNILQKATALTGYDELGKALGGRLMSLVASPAEATTPKPNAKKHPQAARA